MIEYLPSILKTKTTSLLKFLFLLFVIFLPTQFGRHFWPSFSIVAGQRIDYLSPTIYVTDILTILLVAIFILVRIQKVQKSQKNQILIIPLTPLIPVSLLTLYLSIGIFFSASPFVGWSALVKLVEFILLGFVLKDLLKYNSYQNLLVYGLSLGIVGESLLAIAQVFHQGSLNGISYFFGERFFTADTPGIANASLNGILVLRPYATFSHPNVLAGYLVIVMTIIVSSYSPVDITYQVLSIRKIVTGFIIVLGTVALLLTLSRVAIAVWFIILIFNLFSYAKKKIHNTKYPQDHGIILNTILLIGIVFVLFFFTPLHERFFLNITDESITYRWDLTIATLKMIESHILFGIGFGNYLLALPTFLPQFVFHSDLLQPVHNIFLLWFAETGLAGILFVLWFLWKTFKSIKYQVLSIKGQLLLIVVILGMFDHYFLTLQQGQLLLTLVFSLCWVELPSCSETFAQFGLK